LLSKGQQQELRQTLEDSHQTAGCGTLARWQSGSSRGPGEGLERSGVGSIGEGSAIDRRSLARHTPGQVHKCKRLSKKAPGAHRANRAGAPRGVCAVVGPRRDALGVKGDDEECVGAPRAKAGGEGKEALRVTLSVRFCSSENRRGPLAHPSHGQRGGLLPSALSLRQRDRRRQEQAHPLGLGPSRLAHG
jgi:hypothetical protein